MEQYLTDTVLKRVSEFKEDPTIVQYVKDNFETAEAAQEYLINMAVATLIIPVSERP